MIEDFSNWEHYERPANMQKENDWVECSPYPGVHTYNTTRVFGYACSSRDLTLYRYRNFYCSLLKYRSSINMHQLCFVLQEVWYAGRILHHPSKT